MSGGSELALVPLAARYSYALVPLGLGMWLAHYGFHFFTGILTIVPDLGILYAVDALTLASENANFDLAAVALPAGMRPDGLPFGVSLIGQAFTETALLPIADTLHRKLATTLGGSQRSMTRVLN